ncbi:glycosyltransferase [Williamsia herbipolensis]|uniref:Glycosyltransferase n=1 Tax=Williamsia herbipolensis TaxID=1603258 RepID=A0AAU4JX56_9NOCA|nr:glycosyltransferase family 2 protein [Williamsia herbipolensis]
MDRNQRVHRLPSVTVCIPLYHHADTVERALRSVLLQDHDDVEILVVDDASSDRGAEIARGLIRDGDRVVVNDVRLGAAGNHNRCIELARNELIQFVHGDDELLPGALSSLAATFTQADVAMAFAPRRVVSDDPEFLRWCSVLHHRFRALGTVNRADDLITEYMLRGALNNWFGEPTSVMFRRSHAVRAGGFHTDMVQSFDMDLWLHVSAGGRITFVDRELSVRHHTGTTLSAANQSEWKEWIDRPRLIWAVVADSAMPWRARLYGAIWTLNSHPLSMVYALRGPRGQRLRRLRLVLALPFHEFARARRLRANRD